MVRTHGLADEHHPGLQMIEIDLLEEAEIFALTGLRARAAATAHSRDTAALRFEIDGAVACYSSDTRPCDAVVRLARDADILLHDCGGPHRLRGTFSEGHSSALEAAEIASKAGARRLILMHLGSRSEEELEESLGEAAAAFAGPVTLAEDGTTWRLPDTTVRE
jgi:ribonuclease BN (tRNA processing enzyme)